MPSIQAQKTVVKVDLLWFLFNNVQFSYKRVVNEKSTFELSLSYKRVTGSLATLSEETEVNTIGGEESISFIILQPIQHPEDDMWLLL